MSEERENCHIPKLKEQFAEGKINRREFLRYSTLLGMSATAAYAFVGKVTGRSFVAPAKAEEMPMGGKLRISMRVLEVTSPHTYSWIEDSNVGRQVHEYLTRTEQDNITRPYLAESWSASDDLKTWTLKLRNVKWHNGRDFTADDAIWNIKRCLDEETGSSVVTILGVRTREDLLYGAELAEHAATTEGFTFIPCLSRHQGDAPEDCRTGYVQGALRDLEPNPETDLVYLCGNPNMIDETMEYLREERGFPSNRVRREKYTSS